MSSMLLGARRYGRRQGRPLVTSKNRTSRTRDGLSEVMPYGVQHTRDVGAYLTECGEYAWDWPIFWDRPFDPSSQSSCKRCADALARRSITPPPK